MFCANVKWNSVRLSILLFIFFLLFSMIGCIAYIKMNIFHFVHALHYNQSCSTIDTRKNPVLWYFIRFLSATELFNDSTIQGECKENFIENTIHIAYIRENYDAFQTNNVFCAMQCNLISNFLVLNFIKHWHLKDRKVLVSHGQNEIEIK